MPGSLKRRQSVAEITDTVRGYKKHIYQEHAWKYYDIDVVGRSRSKR